MTSIDGKPHHAGEDSGLANPPGQAGTSGAPDTDDEDDSFTHPPFTAGKFHSPNLFSRIGWHEQPSDAIVVSVFEVGGATVADVQWHATGAGIRNSGSSASCPTPVPQALDKAIDQLFRLRPHGFTEIVVRLERDDLWQREWGTLD